MWNQNPNDQMYGNSPHSNFSGAALIPSSSKVEPPLDPESVDDEHGTGDSSGSNNDNIQDSVENLLMSLATRGKGTYVCPHGYDCRKGGVKSDGGLLTFERNSSFRLVIGTSRFDDSG
jgi:hypothetical protein